MSLIVLVRTVSVSDIFSDKVKHTSGGVLKSLPGVLQCIFKVLRDRHFKDILLS